MSKKQTSSCRIPPRLVAGAADPSLGYTAAVRLEEAALWKRLPLIIRKLIQEEATSITTIGDMFDAYFDEYSLLRLEADTVSMEYRVMNAFGYDPIYSGRSEKEAVKAVRRCLKLLRSIERIGEGNE